MVGILDFLEHPLFVSLFSILLSSIAIAEFARRRDRRMELANKRVAFIDETITLLNSAISNLFRVLTEQTEEGAREADEALTEAYTHRLRFDLYARHLFDERFAPSDYENILYCLNAVAEEARNPSQRRSESHEYFREKLMSKWSVSVDEIPPLDHVQADIKELAISLAVCMLSSRKLLSDMLDS